MSHRCFTKSTLATAILANLSFSALATTDEADVEQITVWSTEIKTSSLYLMGEEIGSKQADHVSDLLRILPGVDVGGAQSLNQRITIRSMDDRDLNILIDGATQNSYMYHHMGNLQIHADILKSVDIEVGTNSVVDRGLGGSVRFETKEARDLLNSEQRYGARVHYAHADNAGSDASLTAYGLLTDDIDFLAYFNRVDRENYEVGGGDILDAEGNIIAGTDGKVRGFDGTITDALFKLGWDINDDQRITLGYETYQDEGDYSYRPDMGLATDLAISNSLATPLLWPTEFTRDTLTINYQANFGEDTSLTATAFSNVSELWRDETGWANNPAFAAFAGIVTGEAKNQGFNVLAETVAQGQSEHQFTYGIDIVKYTTDYYADYAENDEASSEESTISSLFVQDRVELTNGLMFIPGVRYDIYSIDSQVIDNTFRELSMAVALEYYISETFVIKASTTELFKGPEIAEVFIGAGLFDTANPDIQAENGVNSELAFAYQDKVRGEDDLTLGATLFRTTIDNYIYDYATRPEVGGRWKDNIGDMEIQGFEAYVGYAVNGLQAQITYSKARSDLDAFDEYSVLDGARIDRQQGDDISASVSYQVPDMDLNLYWEVISVDSVEAGLNLDGATLDNQKDSYTVHNISATWHPEMVEGLSVIVGIDNLFDEFYASHASRTGVSFHPRFGELYLLDYEPGRNVKATLAYRF